MLAGNSAGTPRTHLDATKTTGFFCPDSSSSLSLSSSARALPFPLPFFALFFFGPSTSSTSGLPSATRLRASSAAFRSASAFLWTLLNECFEIFYRDIIACVRALFSDPELMGLLVFRPERHYADPEHQVRVYFDMHTGEWWWSTQEQLDRERPGATMVPIIISSDKTQLTLFGSKTAYPVYMMIGNLPKDVCRKLSRRGQILLTYLPSTNLAHIANQAARRRALANLFHGCLTRVLAPLKDAGVNGIDLTSGEGVTHWGHPIFAMHIGDYPEQLLVTGCKKGECPKCPVDPEEIGEPCARPGALRNLERVLVALGKFDEADMPGFYRECRAASIKLIPHPYWKDLPYVNIYRSITPDILHQLYQGVVKHVISWLKEAYGTEEIDAQCRRLPPNHNVRLFANGITKLQRVTGKEHEDICRILLGLIVGLPLSGGVSPICLVRAVHAILDFLNLAQYPAHTTATLRLLKHSLQRFHANKGMFVDLGIRAHFKIKIPKLHSLEHYIPSIILFGTTDNYDTQYTEQLHIDFAKEAYRATNFKDEFPQMTLWLERREKILRHEAFIVWRLANLDPSHPSTSGPARTATSHHPFADPAFADVADANCAASWSRAAPPQHIDIAEYPSVKAVSFDAAAAHYGAMYFRDALVRFVIRYRSPDLDPRQVERASAAVYFNFRTVPVFHRIKFLLDDVQGFSMADDLTDVTHARPARQDTQGRPVPVRFDTVLVNDGSGGETGVAGYRVGQVRMVFKLPRKSHSRLFPNLEPLKHLAYVEWFTAFTQPDPAHGMYKVSRCIRNRDGARLASVIEVSNIRRSCHLFPQFSTIAPREWSSSSVLDDCATFWVSPFTDRHMYMTLF
ncbi:hypothetical protein BV20DRAFT_1034577 [Pilatotrama ljubarskyi]|nr:hypothetical protein BV20DRAFT_1034577 [Pilatotrama ljubarskyi]